MVAAQFGNILCRRTVIRNQPRALRAKKLRTSTVSAYAGIFLLIVSFLALSYKGGGTAAQTGVVAATSSTTQTEPDSSGANSISVDQLAAANAVTSLAETTKLPAVSNLRETTTTLYIQKQLAQSDTEVISKPQIVQPTTSTERGITIYTAKEGDSLSTIASQFGISVQTLKWANNTETEAVEAGKAVTVPRTDGVVYSVKDGDTVASIAEKYKVDAERIVLYNDLDADAALVKDVKLVLPNGDLPETERPGYVAPRPAVTSYGTGYSNVTSSAASSYARTSVGNKYAYGYCTWYAYERRPEIGSFWGNATSWAASARAAGFTVVQGVPRAGAIFQYGGGYGHVGIVESVDAASGTMVISDMNGISGWGRVGTATVAINKSWNYIY